MRGYTILIIDDDQSVHEVLQEYLTLSGFNVSHAYDGKEGLAAMEGSMPDLALLDVQMPEMDGFTMMDELSKRPAIRSIPVLFLTSLDRYNLKVKGLELGAEDYIVKPFNKAELLSRIRAALRRAERYKKNEKNVEGKLIDIGLAEILQTMEIGHKTAAINLKDMGGEVFMDKGMLIAALRGFFVGVEALRRIFFLEKGSFTISFEPPPEDIPFSPMPLQRILMETVTYVDELKSMIPDDMRENPMIEIPETGELHPEIEKNREVSPVSFFELIAVLEGDMKDNMKLILNCINRGTLKAVSSERQTVN